MKLKSVTLRIPLDQAICNLMNQYPNTPYDEIETWLRDRYKMVEDNYIPLICNPIDLTEEEMEQRKRGRGHSDKIN